MFSMRPRMQHVCDVLSVLPSALTAYDKIRQKRTSMIMKIFDNRKGDTKS